MSFPNLSTLRTIDTDRRNAMAINHLLGRPSYLQLQITGKPTASQVILSTYMPAAFGLLASVSAARAQTAATGTPTFTLKTNGVVAGSISFSGSAGTFSITNDDLPLNALFEVIAPASQDATLSDITLSIAVLR